MPFSQSVLYENFSYVNVYVLRKQHVSMTVGRHGIQTPSTGREQDGRKDQQHRQKGWGINKKML